jgi:predicted outer membrane protein
LDLRAQESLAKLEAGDLAAKRSRDVREFAAKMIRIGPKARVSAGGIRSEAEASFYG